MTAPHVSEDRIASFFPHIKNCWDVCLFHSELTVNHHQGLTIIKINEHVYVFGFQTDNQPNSQLLVNVACVKYASFLLIMSIFRSPYKPHLPLSAFFQNRYFFPLIITQRQKKKPKKTKKKVCCVLAATVKGHALFLFRPTSFLAKLVRSLVASGLELVLLFVFFFVSLQTPSIGFSFSKTLRLS